MRRSLTFSVLILLPYVTVAEKPAGPRVARLGVCPMEPAGGLVAALTFKHIQQRDGRWCIVDLVGKHGRVRTVPTPTLVKVAVDGCRGDQRSEFALKLLF